MTTINSGTSFASTWKSKNAQEQSMYIEKRAKVASRSFEDIKSIIDSGIKVEEVMADLPAAIARGDAKPATLEFKSAPANAKYEKPQISAVAAKSYEEMSKPYQGAEARYVGAQNVNDVMKNAEARGYTADNYIDSVRSDMARSEKDTVFTGAWGNDRITNSLDEYAGWVKEAEAAYAAAKYQQIASAE